MTEERRQGLSETLLVEVGALKVIAENTNKKVDDLNIKVGIQNGRIGTLERWKAYLFGCTTIIVVMVVPIVIEAIKAWLKLK